MCSCSFLRRRIYIPLLSYETSVCISYFPITLTEKNVSTQLATYKAAFLKNSLPWPTCLHASFSTKNDWSWRRLTTTTKKNERPPWLTTTIKKTDHEERLTTTTDHDMTLHHFDLWGRVRVQLLTYVFMSGWKVSIVLLSANTLWVMFAVKKGCVCTHLLTHESMIMCSFEHNFQFVHPMRRVSTKLYQLRDVTTCKFSLKRRVSALVLVTWSPPRATSWHVRTCLSGKFPLFCPWRTDYEVCSL